MHCPEQQSEAFEQRLPSCAHADAHTPLTQLPEQQPLGPVQALPTSIEVGQRNVAIKPHVKNVHAVHTSVLELQ
jgi:hypothetical protein